MLFLELAASSLYGSHYTRIPKSLPSGISLKPLLKDESLTSTPLSIALLFPFSGPKATLGESLRDAALLALFDDPACQFFTLHPFDTENPVALIEELHRFSPDVIIGPVFAPDTHKVLRDLKHLPPLFSLSNDPTLLGRGIFVMGFSPYEEMNFLLRFSIKEGHHRFVALFPETPLGQAMEKYCKALLEEKNVQLKTIFYPLSDDLPLEKVQEWAHQINEFHPDAVFFPDGSPQSQRLVALLKFKNFHYRGVRLLGSSQWDTPKVWKDFNLRGLWVSSYRSPAFQKFQKSFYEAYQGSGTSLGGIVYDIVRLIGAYHNQNEGRALSHHFFKRMQKEKGLQGPISFNADGSPQRVWFVFEHTGRGRKKIG